MRRSYAWLSLYFSFGLKYIQDEEENAYEKATKSEGKSP